MPVFDWLTFYFHVIQYFCFPVVGGGGVGLPIGGGEEGPAFSYSGFLRVVSLSGNLGLGSGCSGLHGYPVDFVRCSVSGSTIVLDGKV